MRGFKTFSARRINERAGKCGVVWQRGCYEHIIRNEKALARIRDYIANNPARRAVTRTTSRERRLPKQGGFETRPYKSPNLCAASRKLLCATANRVARLPPNPARRRGASSGRGIKDTLRQKVGSGSALPLDCDMIEYASHARGEEGKGTNSAELPDPARPPRCPQLELTGCRRAAVITQRLSHGLHHHPRAGARASRRT